MSFECFQNVLFKSSPHRKKNRKDEFMLKKKFRSIEIVINLHGIFIEMM